MPWDGGHQQGRRSLRGTEVTSRDGGRVIISAVSIDPTWLFLSLIPGGIGFVLFVYGKKQQRWPQLIGGIVFMVYPYFTPTALSLTAVGLTVGACVWLAVRLGW